MSETTENPVPDVGTGGDGFSGDDLDLHVQNAPVDAGTDTSTSSDPSEQVTIPVREHRSLKTLQSDHDKLLNLLGPLRETLDRYKGSDLLSMLQQYDEISGDPVLGDLIRQRLTTGSVTLPSPEVSADDPYADEQTVALQRRVEHLEGLLTGVQGQMLNLNQDRGMNKIRSYAERFLGGYPAMSEEESATYQEGMDARIEQLGKTPDGIRQLNDMSWDTYRMLSLDAIEPFREKMLGRRLQETSRQRQEHATDAGPGVGTHGVQMQADLKLPRNQSELVAQAKRTMREAMSRSARSGA